MSKVIHVHLIFEKKNIYFGSISAIFETLTEKQVGITKSSLYMLDWLMTLPNTRNVQ